ncbi:MAG: flagellar hook-length control protein FliK [Lysobacter sp.]
MIAAQVPGSGGTAARVPNAVGEVASGHRDDRGFANLLTSPSTAPASKPPATAGTEAGNEDSDTAETPPEPLLPQQLLALLAISPLAPSAAGSASTATSVAAPGTSSLPGTPDAAATMPATATALAATTAGATAATADSASTMPLAGKPDTGVANAALPVGTTALPLASADAGSTQGNPQAIALDNFAKALGLAAADAGSPSVGADSGTATEPGDRSALLAPTASSSTPSTRATAALAAPLALPTDADAGFDDGFGARIGWLADQRIGRAEIRLNPEHLGAIDVRLQIDGSKVSAEFQSAHADVRHALENSVGRLRDMLGQQGLQLTHADVGQGRGGDQGERAATAGGDDLQSEHDASLGDLPMPRPVLTRGLLDEYA